MAPTPTMDKYVKLPVETKNKHKMDPASFKLIIQKSKEDMKLYVEQKSANSNSFEEQNKNVWKDFIRVAKKKGKKKAKRPMFVWQRKLRDAEIAQKRYLTSIHDLTRVMKLED